MFMLLPVLLEKSIGEATVNKSQIQIQHQRSLVIGLLAPRENVFRQMDVTLYVLVPEMLLLSFTTQLYQHFPWGVTRS